MAVGRIQYRGLAHRREAAARKMRRRGDMMRAHGQQGGLLYEKHRRKIDRSLGYMRDGNVSHYVSVGFRPKTKDRARYGPARRLSRHDTRLEDAWKISEQQEIHMKSEDKLDRMIELIKDDCRRFGMDASKIDALEKDVLIKGRNNDDYSLFYDEDKGYVLTFSERGYCNWGMGSLDEAGFRFLFQRHIVLHDFRSVPTAEKFMAAAFPMFGMTKEYKEAEMFLARKKGRFSCK